MRNEIDFLYAWPKPTDLFVICFFETKRLSWEVKYHNNSSFRVLSEINWENFQRQKKTKLLYFEEFFVQIWAKINFLKILGSISSWMLKWCNFIKKSEKNNNKSLLRKAVSWSTEALSLRQTTVVSGDPLFTGVQ